MVASPPTFGGVGTVPVGWRQAAGGVCHPACLIPCLACGDWEIATFRPLLEAVWIQGKSQGRGLARRKELIFW